MLHAAAGCLFCQLASDSALSLSLSLASFATALLTACGGEVSSVLHNFLSLKNSRRTGERFFFWNNGQVHVVRGGGGSSALGLQLPGGRLGRKEERRGER